MAALASSMDAGLFHEGTSATLVKAGRLAASRALGSYYGLDPLTEGERASAMAEFPELKLEEWDNASSLAFRIEAVKSRRYLNEVASDGKYANTQMLGQLSSGFFDPVDAVTGALAGRWSSLARAGSMDATLLRSMNSVQRQAYYKGVVADMSYMGAARHAFGESAIQFALTEPLTAYAKNAWTNDEYTLADAVASFAMNQAFGTGAGLVGRHLAGKNSEAASAMATKLMQQEITGTSQFNFKAGTPDKIPHAPKPSEFVAAPQGAIQTDLPLGPIPKNPVVEYKNESTRKVSATDGLAEQEAMLASSLDVATHVENNPKDGPALSGLGQALKGVFNVDLRMFSPGAAGFAPSDVGKFHIRSGQTIFVRSDVPAGRLHEVVGHEVFHTLSARSPEAYLKVVDAILASPEPEIRAALARFEPDYYRRSAHTGERGGDARVFDESIAAIGGQIFQKPWFWKSLAETNIRPDLLHQISDIISGIYKKLTAWLDSPGADAAAKSTREHFRGVADSLREAAATLHDKDMTVRSGMQARGIKSYGDYAYRLRESNFARSRKRKPEGMRVFDELLALATPAQERVLIKADQTIHAAKPKTEKLSTGPVPSLKQQADAVLGNKKYAALRKEIEKEYLFSLTAGDADPAVAQVAKDLLSEVSTVDGLSRTGLDIILDERMVQEHGRFYWKWLAEELEAKGDFAQRDAALRLWAAIAKDVDTTHLSHQEMADAAYASVSQEIQESLLLNDQEHAAEEASSMKTAADIKATAERNLDQHEQQFGAISDPKAHAKHVKAKLDDLFFKDYTEAKKWDKLAPEAKAKTPEPPVTWRVEDEPLFAAAEDMLKLVKSVPYSVASIIDEIQTMSDLFTPAQDALAKNDYGRRLALDEARGLALNLKGAQLTKTDFQSRIADALIDRHHIEFGSTVQDHYVNTRGRCAPGVTKEKAWAQFNGDPEFTEDGQLISAGQSFEAAKEHRVSEILGALKQAEESFAGGKTEAWLGSYIDYVNGKPTDPALKPLFDIADKTTKTALGYVNSVGGKIRYLKDFALHSTHNTTKIRGNFAAWKQSVLDLKPDWARIEMAQKVLPGSLRDESSQDSFLAHFFEQREKLAVAEQRQEFDPLQDDLSSKDRYSRALFFEEGNSVIKYDKLWGSGDPAMAFWTAKQRLVERGTYMEHYGPSYYKNAQSLVARVYDMSPTDLKSGGVTSSAGHLLGTMEKGLGVLDNPKDPDLSRRFAYVRALTNAAMSWTAVPSSFVEVSVVKLLTRLTGGDRKSMGFISYLKTMMAGLPSDQAKSFAQANYVAHSAMAHAASSLTFHLGDVKGGAGKLNNLTFRANLMNRHVETVQWAYTDVMSQIWADHASRGPNEQFLRYLRHFDITDGDFAKIAKYADQVEGLDGSRLAPSMIDDSELRQKFSAAWLDGLNLASMRPSAQNAAWASLFSQAGTWHGEAVRLVGMYKPSALAVHTKLKSRFRLTSETGGYFHMGNVATGLAFAGQALFYGWMGTVAKDLMKGREPMHFLSEDQRNMDNLVRLLASTGLHGVLSDTGLSYDAERGGLQFTAKALGPLPSSMVGIAGAALNESPTGAAKAWSGLLDLTPGAGLPVWNVAKHYIMGAAFNQNMATLMRSRLDYREGHTGQEGVIESGLFDK